MGLQISSPLMSSEAKMITLTSSDNETFEVEEAVAFESQTIKKMVENNCAETAIPLPNLTSKTLAKVIEYCKKHAEANKRRSDDEDDLRNFDADFLKVDKSTLFELLSAACDLKITSLIDLTALEVADMIEGKGVEELREIFNIQNDYSPEEEEEIRMEYARAFK